MAHKVVFFLGAGGNVGASSVALFKKQGYKVASAARSAREEVTKHSDLHLTADFSDPSVIRGLFEKVEQELGAPNVVVYNPYSYTKGTDPENPISTSVEGFQTDLAVNTVSAYAAAQAAVEGFEKLPADIKKTYIFTGNAANTFVGLPSFYTLGASKSASWYMIQSLVATKKFADYRFYYADERTPDGKAMPFVSGPGHAEFFVQLAEQANQGEPLATFVRGKGYVKFDGNDGATLPQYSAEEIVDFGYGAPGTEEAKYGY